MDGPFTLISSNIRYDNPADGGHAWPHRREGLATILRDHQPLVIATQEGRQPQLLDLAGLLPHHDLVDGHRPWIEERMYPCLFVRNGTKVTASGDIWLSETPEVPGSTGFGSTFPRLCTWARLLVGEQTLVCVSAHLDHLRAETRAHQANVMGHQLAALLRPEDRLVLMGDFNEGVDGPARSNLLRKLPSLVDPWLTLGRPEEVSHHRFDGEHENGARIDWIL